MTTSGTYTFNPSLGEAVLYAYGLCQVRRPSIRAEHMTDARMAANLVTLDWSNKQPNLWTVDLQSIPLIDSISTYSIPPETILMLDAYLTTNDGDITSQTDTYLLPISRTEYASFPDKRTPGKPTVYWFDRLIAPTVTLWQPPNDSFNYTFNYYRVRQIQDNIISGGVTMDIPQRWLPAFVFSLAEQLAWTYAPDFVDKLNAKAMSLYQTAASNDIEEVNMYVFPALGGYFRR